MHARIRKYKKMKFLLELISYLSNTIIVTMKFVSFALVCLILGLADAQKWMPMTKTSFLPVNCHVGGYEQKWDIRTNIFIGRKRFGVDVIVGKVVFDFQKIYRESNFFRKSFRIYI